jgi:hypothetical protein
MRRAEDLPTPDNRNYPYGMALLGMVAGAAFYWGLLQFPGAVLQLALRLPGQLVIVRGLVPLLEQVGTVLPALVVTTISHLLCLIPFVVFGAAVFARERIWATVVGLVLFFLLGLALIFVWRFGGI